MLVKNPEYSHVLRKWKLMTNLFTTLSIQSVSAWLLLQEKSLTNIKTPSAAIFLVLSFVMRVNILPSNPSKVFLSYPMHSKAKREQWNWPKDGITASAVGVIRGGSIKVAPWTNGGPGDTTSSKPRTEPANHFLHTTHSADQAQVTNCSELQEGTRN
jgi:hypothetical protein